MVEPIIDVRTDPARYRHWKLSLENGVAYLTMDVNEDGGLKPGYKLKLNSYDLGVDIELADAVQRLRFEHPEIGAVVIRSQRDRIFCSGANINMLGLSTHHHKVNFCKFTNETRLGIEDASLNSDQTYICSINGIAAGGGYDFYARLIADYMAPHLPGVTIVVKNVPGAGHLIGANFTYNARADGPLTRLDLAEWIVAKENPLTARVFVNRLWKQFFGTGLSKVLDDMGAQGEPPVNAALLDWLACEFRDGGWDVKRMVRTIVTSATYRQTSAASLCGATTSQIFHGHTCR